MLYDFHQYHNSLHKASIHATYLVSGIKLAKKLSEDDYEGFGDSAVETGSIPRATMAQSLSLVCEEGLGGEVYSFGPLGSGLFRLTTCQAHLGKYREITSMHIYSLAPGPQSDFTVFASIASSSPVLGQLISANTAPCSYGRIQNQALRWRDSISRQNLCDTIEFGFAQPARRPIQAASIGKKYGAAYQSSVRNRVSSGTANNAVAASTRVAIGDILHSFANAASKPPARSMQFSKRAGSGATTLSDDGEAADECDMLSFREVTTDALDCFREGPKEQKEGLKRMMEDDCDDNGNEGDDDEEMNDASGPNSDSGAAAEPEDELMESERFDELPARPISSTANSPRKGKRLTTTKKCIMDDHGYLVTIQDSGWEHHPNNEDTRPATTVSTPVSAPSSAAGRMVKKTSLRKDSGNIMSFFPKK